MLAVRRPFNHGKRYKQVGKVGKAERGEEKYCVCRKSCQVHYMLMQIGMFEVCKVKSFL